MPLFWQVITVFSVWHFCKFSAGKLTQSESEVQSLKADVARLREVARCAEEDRAKLLEACDNMKTLKEDKKSLGNKLQAAERDRDR